MAGIFSLAGMQQMGVILAFKDAYSAQMTAFDRKLAGLSARTTARGRTMGAAFLPVAKGVSVAGAATVLGLGLATKTAVDFRQKMAEVKTMMLDQLEYYPAVERAVRGTATAYGQSHEAAAEAAYFLLSAGVEASKVPLALKASAMEATAGLASLNTVADIGTTVINAYGWEAERLDDVFDKLQMTVVLGKTRLDELASSAGRAYSIAAPLGVAFEQVNVAMAGVTKAGYSTEEAVTAVRSLMLGIRQPTSDAGKALREVGGAAYEAAAGKRDLVGAIKALAVAPHAEERLRELFPNIRAMGAFGALGKQVDWMTGALEKMEGATGTTKKALNVMAEEPYFKMQQLKSETREAAIAIGEALLPAAKSAAEGMVPLARGVGDFAKAHPDVTRTVGKIAFLAALSYPLVKIGGALGKVAGHIVTIAKWAPAAASGVGRLALGPWGTGAGAVAAWFGMMFKAGEAAKVPKGLKPGEAGYGTTPVRTTMAGAPVYAGLPPGMAPVTIKALNVPPGPFIEFGKKKSKGDLFGRGAGGEPIVTEEDVAAAAGGGGGGGGAAGLVARGAGSRVFVVHFEQGSIVLQSNNPALKPLVKKALDEALTELEVEYAT